jgi:hypothetical protein
VRWQIDGYHRTLKSGCRIEERQLGTAKCLQAALAIDGLAIDGLAIDLVVAWRIFYLAKLGRETPELPCIVFFDDDEWQAPWLRANPNPDTARQPIEPARPRGCSPPSAVSSGASATASPAPRPGGAVCNASTTSPTCAASSPPPPDHPVSRADMGHDLPGGRGRLSDGSKTTQTLVSPKPRASTTEGELRNTRKARKTLGRPPTFSCVSCFS